MSPTRTSLFLILLLFSSLSSPVSQALLVLEEPEGPKTPMPIRQGPLLLQQQPSSAYYWYQVGAIGNSSAYDFTGANITVRTVYDRVNNDAHSYWVGGHLSNGAFIQVGYLNGLSTTNQPYCCATFYEYFPANQDECCDPVIGREASAGPIGSWHTYSMLHAGGGVWSFYMDGKLLGSTPPLGATSSGQNAPVGIAEVAQAASNTDILGPAEFKNMQIRTSSNSWQSVREARSLIWYGEGTPTGGPPNLYGVREVNNADNNFLAGSHVPQLSSPAPPPGGPLLWPVQNPSNSLSVSFLDSDRQSFSPEWVSFRSSSGTSYAFYTDSKDYQTLRISPGNWLVDRVMWHNVNVAGQGVSVIVPGVGSLVVPTTVASLEVRVFGSLLGLAVSGANVVTSLPDTATATATTDASGLASVQLLPPGTYYLRVTVPYGLPAISHHNVPSVGDVTVKVIGLGEMLIIVIVPVALAMLVTVYAVRRERLRAASMPTIPTYVTLIGNCQNCGAPLHTGDLLCPNCKTLTRPSAPT